MPGTLSTRYFRGSSVKEFEASGVRQAQHFKLHAQNLQDKVLAKDQKQAEIQGRRDDGLGSG